MSVPLILSISVIPRSRASAQIRAVGYLYLYPAPRPVALFVRRFVAEAINLSQIINDLIIDAVQVLDLACRVIEPAAFLRQQGQSLARILIHPFAKTTHVVVIAFGVEID